MNRMQTKWRPRLLSSLIVLILIVLISFSLALAAGEILPRSLVGSGGGQVSQSGLALHSAVGQPVVGAVHNNLNLCSGYLCGAGAPPVSGSDYSLYLPAVLRP